MRSRRAGEKGPRAARASRLGLLAVLLACACAVVAPPAVAVPTAGAATEEGGRTPFIVGGTGVSQGELPSLVFVAYIIPNGKDEAVVCTGTVVAPRLVLTAAHCVEPERIRIFLENFRVFAGNVNWKTSDRTELQVVRVMSNPGYNPNTGEHDAALLELSAPAGVPPMTVARRHFWQAGDEGEIAGWGKRTPHQRGPTYLLHRGPTALVSYRECGESGGRWGLICSVDPRHKSTTCFGDSGGPLLMRRPGDRRLVLIGIVHGGDYCNPKFPGTYTPAGSIFNWLRGRIAEVANATS